ncbi:MAG: hypothetical protein QM527_14690 [Alphaproteobacteria bacterium]|nr:hypothetical protein [Alphaproteobacteria bacterium]
MKADQRLERPATAPGRGLVLISFLMLISFMPSLNAFAAISEVAYQVYAQAMVVDEAAIELLELAREDNDRDFNVRRVIDKFDASVPLTEKDMENLHHFNDAFMPTKASIDHFLNEKTGIFPNKLAVLMDSKKNAAINADRFEEAQSWERILNESNSKNIEMDQRLKDLSGVASKVSAILSHLQESDGAPQKTLAPLAQPAVTGSMGEKGILKNKFKDSYIDPRAVRFDDGTNDPVPESAFRRRVVDETLPTPRVRMHRSMADLNKFDPSNKDFTVSFSAGRAVKSFDKNQAPNPNLEVQPDHAERATIERTNL